MLGSSLMMTPLWENEADFLNRDVDIVADRGVQYLGAVVQKKLPGSNNVCFNFALPGAMLSDDYMVIRTVLVGQGKPRIIVLGLSPRDFIDNGFSCAASSQHYKYLARFTNTEELTELAMPKLWQRVPYFLHKGIYFEDKKGDIQALTAEALKTMISRVFKKPKSWKPAEEVEAESRLAIYQTELEKGLWLAHPRAPDHYDQAEDAQLLKMQANKEGYKNQSAWFLMSLALCRKEGIKPIIVNMPLTQKNIALFAPGVYENCVNLMAEEAHRNNCPFIDLQKSNKFVLTDFTDMCHMDASGGKKLLNAIAEVVTCHPDLIKDLKPAPNSLANQAFDTCP